MLSFVRRRWLPLLIAVAVVGGGGAFFATNRAQAEREKASAASETKAFESPYAAVANGRADVEGGVIAVAARRGGVVREVYVQEGDRVRKGQILARQEDDEARLAVQRAAAEVAQAQSALQLTEVQIATARREYERLANLKDRNFVAGQRLDGARDRIAEAEAQLAAQRAAVATARARLGEAQFDQELTVIRAPADGRIIRRYANPGSGASTLNVSNMFDLEPDAPRIIRAEAPEKDIPNITIGQAVEIVPEADDTKAYAGVVIRRSGMFGARKLQSDDPSERTDERVVEVVVSADGAPLLIGQRVLVKFMKPGQPARTRGAAPQLAQAAGAR